MLSNDPTPSADSENSIVSMLKKYIDELLWKCIPQGLFPHIHFLHPPKKAPTYEKQRLQVRTYDEECEMQWQKLIPVALHGTEITISPDSKFQTKVLRAPLSQLVRITTKYGKKIEGVTPFFKQALLILEHLYTESDDALYRQKLTNMLQELYSKTIQPHASYDGHDEILVLTQKTCPSIYKTLILT